MRKRCLSMAKVGAVFGILALWPVHEAQAASFDCTKATTKIEKLICKDAELSKLDEEMAKAYETALPKAPDLSLLKQQQRDWLKDRNLCSDSSCLGDQYQLRIGELQRIGNLIPLATTEESHYFEKEAEKLKVIQDVVRRQKFVWYNPYDKEPEYCTEFKKDFIIGLYLEAVEPDFRTNDPSDPRFEELNRCIDPQVHPNESFEGEFYGVKNLGGPPFRYYTLEVDNDPKNGNERILYSEPTKTESGTGYVWIDSDKCLIRGGVGQDGIRKNSTRTLYRLTSLARYKDDLIVVGITPSSWATEIVSYDFSMWSLRRQENYLGCPFHFKLGQSVSN